MKEQLLKTFHHIVSLGAKFMYNVYIYILRKLLVSGIIDNK